MAVNGADKAGVAGLLWCQGLTASSDFIPSGGSWTVSMQQKEAASWFSVDAVWASCTCMLLFFVRTSHAPFLPLVPHLGRGHSVHQEGVCVYVCAFGFWNLFLFDLILGPGS